MLKDIVALIRALKINSTQSYSFGGEIVVKANGNIDRLLLSTKDLITEAYYPKDNLDIDFNNIKADEKIIIKVNLSKLPDFYMNKNDFIRANKFALKQDEFYIHEIDYYSSESQQNNFITNYLSNIKLIDFLKNTANYSKEVNNQLQLFFYKADTGLELPIDYNQDNISIFPLNTNSITELSEHFKDRPDSKERKQIFINELINSLNNTEASFQNLISKWQFLLDNYQKSFDLYLAGFSFEKVKTAAVEHFHDLTDRIHSTLLKFAGYIYAIPVAYILLIRFFDFSGNSLVKDSFLLFIGTLFFIIIWFVSFPSISDAIQAIEKDINAFSDKLGSDKSLDEIRSELDNHKTKVIPRQKNKLLIVKIITALIFICMLSAFISIHHKKLNVIFANISTEQKTLIIPEKDTTQAFAYKDSINSPQTKTDSAVINP